MTKFGEIYRDIILSVTGKGSGGGGGGSVIDEYVKSVTQSDGQNSEKIYTFTDAQGNTTVASTPSEYIQDTDTTISNAITGNHTATLSSKKIQNGSAATANFATIHLRDASHSTTGKYHIDIADSDGNLAQLEWSKPAAAQKFTLTSLGYNKIEKPTNFYYDHSYSINRTTGGFYTKGVTSSHGGDFYAKVFDASGEAVGQCMLSYATAFVKFFRGYVDDLLSGIAYANFTLSKPSGVTLPADSIKAYGHYAGNRSDANGKDYSIFMFDVPFNVPTDTNGLLSLRFAMFIDLSVATSKYTHTTVVS